jgi:hypothetical protein
MHLGKPAQGDLAALDGLGAEVAGAPLPVAGKRGWRERLGDGCLAVAAGVPTQVALGIAEVGAFGGVGEWGVGHGDAEFGSLDAHARLPDALFEWKLRMTNVGTHLIGLSCSPYDAIASTQLNRAEGRGSEPGCGGDGEAGLVGVPSFGGFVRQQGSATNALVGGIHAPVALKRGREVAMSLVRLVLEEGQFAEA